MNNRTFTILFTTDIIVGILCVLVDEVIASIIMGAAAVVTFIVFVRYQRWASGRQLRD